MTFQYCVIILISREMYSREQMANVVGKTTNMMKIISKQLPAEKLARNLHGFVEAQEQLGITDNVWSFFGLNIYVDI